MIALLAYLATIPAANWMIGHVGHCIPSGPCVISVGFGLDAPSGVLMVGAALVLRDLVQRRMGKGWALGAIIAGAALSAMIAPPAIVLASVVAFAVSEFLDFAIFTPLQRRGLIIAVAVSSAAGAVVDSALFLWIAFGSLDFIAGQVVGKLMMIAAACAVLALARAGRAAQA